VLRTAWGLASVAQWFLIGRYFDTRRGVLPKSECNLKPPLKKLLFVGTMVAGAVAFCTGVYSVALGHSNAWAFIPGASMVFWGMTLLLFALQWRSSPEWSVDRLDSLGL